MLQELLCFRITGNYAAFELLGLRLHLSRSKPISIKDHYVLIRTQRSIRDNEIQAAKQSIFINLEYIVMNEKTMVLRLMSSFNNKQAAPLCTFMNDLTPLPNDRTVIILVQF